MWCAWTWDIQNIGRRTLIENLDVVGTITQKTHGGKFRAVFIPCPQDRKEWGVLVVSTRGYYVRLRISSLAEPLRPSQQGLKPGRTIRISGRLRPQYGHNTYSPASFIHVQFSKLSYPRSMRPYLRNSSHSSKKLFSVWYRHKNCLCVVSMPLTFSTAIKGKGKCCPVTC
jgi:hypothetical protein